MTCTIDLIQSKLAKLLWSTGKAYGGTWKIEIFKKNGEVETSLFSREYFAYKTNDEVPAKIDTTVKPLNVIVREDSD
jgi:hypothetical protein